MTSKAIQFLTRASNPGISALLVLYVLAWVLSHLVSDTNLDPYGDMLENFAWGQEFAWGNDKHPPLLGWISGMWFSIFPTNQASYHLLAYGNAALGLAGIYVLAGRLGLQKIALAAAVVMSLALPYSTLAVKFNANTILLPLWPWVVVAWLSSQSAGLATQSGKRFLWAGLLGVLAALCLLGKYYSGVLLLSLGIITLATLQGRQWLASPYPWIALTVALLTLAPHLIWLGANDFATFQYVQDQGGGEIDLRQLGKFMLIPVGYWLIAWLAAVFSVPGALPRGLWLSWLPRGRGDVLFWLAWLPFLLTLMFGLTGFVSLSLPWAIPMGFAFSILWYRNLITGASEEVISSVAGRSTKIFMGWLCLVLLLSPIYAWQQGEAGNKNYYLPRQESALMLMSLWQQSQSEPLVWVSGDVPEAGLVAFYGDPEIRILNQAPAQPTAGGVIFCPLGIVQNRVKGEVNANPPVTTACTQAADHWSAGRAEQVIKAEYSVAKSGLRFFQHIPFRYRVYLYEHRAVK